MSSQPPADDRPEGLLPIQFADRVPEGDDRTRKVCVSCGFVDFVNPRIVVGSVVEHGERILLCRRAIEPRRGFWTLPAGFLERGETLEAREEALAAITIDALLAVYDVTHIAQVQVMFRASLPDGRYAPGPESLEAALFGWEEIPWEDLAFPTVVWALNQARAVRGQTAFAPFRNPDRGRFAFPATGPEGR